MGSSRKEDPLTLAVACTSAAPTFGVVEGLLIESVETVAEGRSFGRVGPYENVVGRLALSLDPATERIVDLDRAPRGSDGRVRFETDLYLLRPLHPERGRVRSCSRSQSGRRGDRPLLQPGRHPHLRPGHQRVVGRRLLVGRGLYARLDRLQFDIPDRDDLLRVDVVPATAGGRIEGLVRADHVFEEESDLFELGHVGHRAYLPTAAEDEPRCPPPDCWRARRSSSEGARSPSRGGAARQQ